MTALDAPRFMMRALALLALLVSSTAFAKKPDLSWILLHRKDTSVTMSGNINQIGDARKLQKGNEPLFYFRKGGQGWVIRDPGTIAQIEALFQPQQALGDKQSALGDKQSALGEKQAAVGAKQAKLGEKMARARDDRTRAELEAHMNKLEKEQEALEALQEPLEAEQEKLNAEQEALQAKAEARLPQIIDEAARQKLVVPAK